MTVAHGNIKARKGIGFQVNKGLRFLRKQLWTF